MISARVQQNGAFDPKRPAGSGHELNLIKKPSEKADVA
jgi:hypothetical protein